MKKEERIKRNAEIIESYNLAPEKEKTKQLQILSKRFSLEMITMWAILRKDRKNATKN